MACYQLARRAKLIRRRSSHIDVGIIMLGAIQKKEGDKATAHVDACREIQLNRAVASAHRPLWRPSKCAAPHHVAARRRPAASRAQKASAIENFIAVMPIRNRKPLAAASGSDRRRRVMGIIILLLEAEMRRARRASSRSKIIIDIPLEMIERDPCGTRKYRHFNRRRQLIVFLYIKLFGEVNTAKTLVGVRLQVITDFGPYAPENIFIIMLLLHVLISIP